MATLRVGLSGDEERELQREADDGERAFFFFFSFLPGRWMKGTLLITGGGDTVLRTGGAVGRGVATGRTV